MLLRNPYGYGQLSPYINVSAPVQTGQASAAGGKTLLIIASAIALVVLIGMALGLGLGIGAAGIVSNTNLVNVTNTTSNT